MRLQKKGKKREREGNQNKSRLELYAESWSGKTEQIKVTGNKILLINRNREERDIKTWRLWKKKKERQRRIVTVGKCRRKEVLGVFKVVWKKRKSFRLVLFEMNVSETKQKEENKRNQKLS